MKNNNTTSEDMHLLKLVATTGSHKEVAIMLHISLPNVKDKLGKVRKKLSVDTTTQAVYKAAKEGWI